MGLHLWGMFSGVVVSVLPSMASSQISLNLENNVKNFDGEATSYSEGGHRGVNFSI